MNLLKLTILILFLIISKPLMSQTKIIAHKSHSGKEATLHLSSSEDNFGLPTRSVRRIRRLPDMKTLIIDYNYYKSDTLHSDHVFMFPNSIIDSLRGAGYHMAEDVECIGFSKKYKGYHWERKKFESPFGWQSPPEDPFSGNALLMSILLGCMGLVGWYSWQTGKKKLKPAY